MNQSKKRNITSSIQQLIKNYYQKLNNKHNKLMPKSNNKNILFTLQLKVFDKLIDVNVCHADDKKSLIQRVCKQNSIASQLYSQIQQKILHSLNKLLKSESVPPSLLEKVLKFLQKKSESQQLFEDTPAHILQSPIYPVQEQKELQQQQHKKSEPQDPYNLPNFTKNNYLYQGDQRLVTFLNTNTPNHSPRDIPQPIQQDLNMLRTRNLNVLSNRNKDKQIKKIAPQNETKLRAYKNVYNKCKNPQIKQKTKEYIEQITHPTGGKFQQQNKHVQPSYRNRYKENQQIQEQQTMKTYNHARRNSNYMNAQPIVQVYNQRQSQKKNSSNYRNVNLPLPIQSTNNFYAPKAQNPPAFYAPQKRISYESNIYIPPDRTGGIDSTRVYNSQYQLQKTRNNSFIRPEKYVPNSLNNTTTNLRSKSYQRIAANNTYQTSGCIRSNRQNLNGVYQKDYTNILIGNKNIPTIATTHLNNRITQRSKSLYSLTRKYHYLDEY